MARLSVKGEYVGPGEQKTAERLAAELPDAWVIFAGRKLPGENRDDVDLIVVGQSLIFVLEEKAWGPRIVCDDNYWYVNSDPRPNPLNRIAQLARKVAGLLRDRANGYRNLRGRRVVAGVILSHDAVQLLSGRRHDPSEHIWSLADAAHELQQLDHAFAPPLGVARRPVIAYLDDQPASTGHMQLGDYGHLQRIEVPGLEEAYFATSTDGQHVILKCYHVHQLRELGDPSAFLERESRALNKLAEVGRTWRALPFFEDASYGVFVVPVVPPHQARTLEASVHEPGPERTAGQLDGQVARNVTADAFSALADVHDYGMVHRALHPRRIWLGRRMRVLFSDFHLARIRDDVSIALWATDGDISEPYRAPECKTNVGLATDKSDVYSLTLCLVTWLLGRPVDTAAPLEDAAHVISDHAWAAPLLDALNPDSQQRPTAEDLAHRLTVIPDGTDGTDSTDQATHDPQVFEPDAVIDARYEVKRELGRGGFATSWLVYDRQLNDTKVLKQFHHGVPEELRTEFRAANSLRHDLCGAVYHVQMGQEPHYLVSEYVEGDTLAEAGTDRSVNELRTVAAHVLQALAYIHGKDLVHGDVTPANIVVASDGSGSAKLIDFGLAVAIGEPHAGWNPRFAAPEVVRGDTASAQSDLFGFAASMIFAMLGRAAFTADQEKVLVAREPTDGERDSWGEDGVALLRALFQAIKGIPSERPSTAADFLALVQSTRPSDVREPNLEQADRSPQINPYVDRIRRLYRGSASGNAGNRGLDDEFAVQTYAPTQLDRVLLPQVIDGELDLVLLSGNPGDGKTSLLVQLGDELRHRGGVQVHADDAGWRIRLGDRMFHAVYDASESHGELTSDDLLHQTLRPVLGATDGPATALIAINDGRLLQFFTDNEGEYEDWKLAIDAQLRGEPSPDPRVALVDLKRRSLATHDLSDGLAGQALAKLTDPALWDICSSCSAQPHCPIYANRTLLSGSGKEAFNELTLISHLRRRRRATFRDVRSAAAWLLTGDRQCQDIHDLLAQGRTPSLMPDAMTHDLAFSTTSADYLINEWTDLDPASVAAPSLDSFRRSHEGIHSTLRYVSTGSVARAVYLRELPAGPVPPEDLRAYRYLAEFLGMLRDDNTVLGKNRLLLGISRLAGAFGYLDDGLAMSGGADDSTWAVLHVIPADDFTLSANQVTQPYVEAIPDTLTLRHHSGPTFHLTLDTAEVILRAAEGEIVNDPASDAIRQEIDSFVNKLGRQPSTSARIVDSSGSVAEASVRGSTISLDRA